MHRRIPTLLATLALAAALSPSAPAQNNRPPNSPPNTPAYSPRPALTATLARIDSELADLTLSRAGTAADKLPALELRIDLRILARWTLLAALDSEDLSDAQAIFFLRSQILLRAVAFADAYSGPGTPALASFHAATFKLKPPTSPAEADTQSKDAAIALLSLTPSQGFDAKPLRPPTIPTPKRPPNPSNTDPTTTTPPQDPAARIRALAISNDLRRQLLLLAERAASASEPAESKALRSSLDIAVRVAEGLSSNLAVSPSARETLERDLASAVALTIDPRLRASAEPRLRAIEPYARLLIRVSQMNLSADQRATFAPVIAFARTSADGPAALTAIETYLKLTSEFDTRFPPSYKPPEKPPAYRTAAEQSLKQFALHRAQLESAAARISSLADVTTPLAELRHHFDTLDFLERLPPALDTLAPIPTRPPTALPRRITLAINALSAPEPSPERAAAKQLLADLLALAAAQDATRTPLLADVPSEVISRFAVSADRLDAKRKSLISEQLQLLASNTPPDRAKLARLARLPDLAATLTTAAQLTSALTALDTRANLDGRWVDLQLPPGALTRLTDPLANSLRGSFSAFVEDSAEPFDRFPQIHTRLQLLTDYLTTLASRTEKLPVPPPANPDDPLLLLQQLLTPFHQAPNQTERFLSLTLSTTPANTPVPPQLLQDILHRLQP